MHNHRKTHATRGKVKYHSLHYISKSFKQLPVSITLSLELQGHSLSLFSDTHTHTRRQIYKWHLKWGSFLYLEDTQLIRVIVCLWPQIMKCIIGTALLLRTEEREHVCVCICVSRVSIFAWKQDWDVIKHNFVCCDALCSQICTIDGS